MAQGLPGATHLHLACHGGFDPNEPLDSALYLSGGDRLTLRDLLDGNLDLSSQRLAVLSACQTGITEFDRVPDEVIGLPAGFLQAGVPGVVATLWPVNDQSTAVLVAEFYRLLLAERQDPATALARARGHLRDATARDLAEWFERRYDDSGGTDRSSLRSRRRLPVAPRPGGPALRRPGVLGRVRVHRPIGPGPWPARISTRARNSWAEAISLSAGFRRREVPYVEAMLSAQRSVHRSPGGRVLRELPLR